VSIPRSALRIRPEAPEDHNAIGDVVARAFGSPAEAALVDRIRESPGYVPEMALVADVDGVPVGHVMVSDAELHHGRGVRRISMLSPLAVAPDHQRRGIGSALVRAVLDLADARGEPIVVLEGDPAYYSRLGFEPATTFGIVIHLPDWAPPEAAQVACLRAYDAADPTLRGTVVYPPAFDDLAAPD
jgi:putative acetyltransferase